MKNAPSLFIGHKKIPMCEGKNLGGEKKMGKSTQWSPTLVLFGYEWVTITAIIVPFFFFFFIIKCVGSICTMADRYPSTLNYVNTPSSVFFLFSTGHFSIVEKGWIKWEDVAGKRFYECRNSGPENEKILDDKICYLMGWLESWIWYKSCCVLMQMRKTVSIVWGCVWRLYFYFEMHSMWV